MFVVNWRFCQNIFNLAYERSFGHILKKISCMCVEWYADLTYPLELATSAEVDLKPPLSVKPVSCETEVHLWTLIKVGLSNKINSALMFVFWKWRHIALDNESIYLSTAGNLQIQMLWESKNKQINEKKWTPKLTNLPNDCD